MIRRSLLVWTLLLSSPAFTAKVMTVAKLPIPGTPEFVRVAKDVIDARCAIDPSICSGAGLFEDSVRVPSFSLASVAAQHARLQADIDALKAMPWRTWPVDAQIDFRWIYANARAADHILMSEKLYLHRPGAWLEPTANNFIALLTYAPERVDLRRKIWPMIPPLVAEMRTVTSPTMRDAATTQGLIDGLLSMLKAEKADPARDAAVAALTAYAADLKELKGAAGVRRRRRRQLRLDPEERGAPAVDAFPAPGDRAERARLRRRPDGGAEARAGAGTEGDARAARIGEVADAREAPLALQPDRGRRPRRAEEVRRDHRPGAASAPSIARETPDAMVPLTGDGGSMNPPPTYVKSTVGDWNVEHFHEDWTVDRRVEAVLGALNQRVNGMGPYAAHEGVPGHHLQLSIARLVKDPIRSILADGIQNEGWALYAEDMFWRDGGLGPSAERALPDAGFLALPRPPRDLRRERRVRTLVAAAGGGLQVDGPGAGQGHRGRGHPARDQLAGAVDLLFRG